MKTQKRAPTALGLSKVRTVAAPETVLTFHFNFPENIYNVHSGTMCKGMGEVVGTVTGHIRLAEDGKADGSFVCTTDYQPVTHVVLQTGRWTRKDDNTAEIELFCFPPGSENFIPADAVWSVSGQVAKSPDPAAGFVSCLLLDPDKDLIKLILEPLCRVSSSSQS
eukprot:CAMPEP_0175156894 /NCGR_PEP_ID=MMETSP0087-20121206/21877_1 /TAXON_ID=136419 /ORGANISM="Unknown Unknown, Strain D1" /LENGTH=164 /DNA_ID=CAMNT_0016444397 /DNA_START=97 /DNA_END=591 /DNA_ORIENTATION=-